MKLKSAISALNDKQRFNSQSVKSVIDIAASNLEERSVDSFLSELDEISKTRNGSEKGETAEEIRAYIKETDLKSYQEYIKNLSGSGIKIVTVLDEDFPQSLQSIADPPLCLYVDGDISSIQDGITVVGTRSATDHRIETAHEIAQEIVREFSIPVVSGLANGVDTAAHEGAIEAGGETVAALPGDIENVKPASNKELGKKITKNGALLSEVSTFAGFHKGRYLERNRITSALGRAVIVVASKDSGGTIKQAELALKQGKPRFVYKSPEDDGQTPKVLIQEMGFKEFESVSELTKLVSESSTKDLDADRNMTFENF